MKCGSTCGLLVQRSTRLLSLSRVGAVRHVSLKSGGPYPISLLPPNIASWDGTAEDFKSLIIYEDDDFVAAYKPPFVRATFVGAEEARNEKLADPSYLLWPQTMQEMFDQYLGSKISNTRTRLPIAASGVMVTHKNRLSAFWLKGEVNNYSMTSQYIGVVNPVVEAPLVFSDNIDFVNNSFDVHAKYKIAPKYAPRQRTPNPYHQQHELHQSQQTTNTENIGNNNVEVPATIEEARADHLSTIDIIKQNILNNRHGSAASSSSSATPSTSTDAAPTTTTESEDGSVTTSSTVNSNNGTTTTTNERTLPKFSKRKLPRNAFTTVVPLGNPFKLLIPPDLVSWHSFVHVDQRFILKRNLRLQMLQQGEHFARVGFEFQDEHRFLAMHAYSITLTNPHTLQPFSISCPPPRAWNESFNTEDVQNIVEFAKEYNVHKTALRSSR